MSMFFSTLAGWGLFPWVCLFIALIISEGQYSGQAYRVAHSKYHNKVVFVSTFVSVTVYF